jgi:hypothetical protein
MLPAVRQVLQENSRCAPIVLVPDSLPVARTIEDVLLLDECSIETDWTSGVLYLPLL